MNAKAQFWIVYVVAFDDTSETPESRVEPFVGKEMIDSLDDAEITALVRGGVLAATLRGNEDEAERTRVAVEAEVLRR